jgi:hypothetical protein
MRVPARPFQAPPLMIDLTKDAQYELKWQPILPAAKRDGKEDPDAAYEYIYSRRELDLGLFDDFQTQGEKLHAMNPGEAGGTSQQVLNFWAMEKTHANKARDVIKTFKGIKPHDSIFKIEP